MSIEETADILAKYLRGESAADVLGTGQEPQDGPAIRDALLATAAAGRSIAEEEPEVPEKLATATIPDSVDSD